MMPGGDETQVQERELLENYVQFILNALGHIKGRSNFFEVCKTSNKENVHLQEKYPVYMFYVGPNPPSHPYLPEGIAVNPAKFAEYLDVYLAEPKRCKWCNGILD